MGIATTPEAEHDRRAHYGQRPLSGPLRFIRELAEKNITITKFYATGVTPTGIAILRNAGFQELGQTGKRLAFELDTLHSEAPLAVRYRKMLGKSTPDTASKTAAHAIPERAAAATARSSNLLRSKPKATHKKS